MDSKSIRGEVVKFIDRYKIDTNKDSNRTIKEWIWKVQYYVKNQAKFHKCDIRKY